MDENQRNIKFIFENTVQENNENCSSIINTPNSVDSLAQTPESSDADERATGSATPERELPVRNMKPRTPNFASRPKVPNVPNVVLAGKIYEQKRIHRMEEILRKEREQRQFHAKKAPNFNSMHAARTAKRSNDEPNYTTPVTPNVVHHHRKNVERIRIKVSA